MEGTVNWAKREDGRPAFAGTAVATGAAGTAGALTSTGVAVAEGFDLGVTGVGIGLAGEEETGMDGGLTGARGLELVEGAVFSADLTLGTGDFATGYLRGATALATGTVEP